MDINAITGVKVTGDISNWQKWVSLDVVRSVRNIETPPEDFYVLDKCAMIADISKWQGEVSWPVLLDKLGRITFWQMTSI
jgi:hypothetical protein